MTAFLRFFRCFGFHDDEARTGASVVFESGVVWPLWMYSHCRRCGSNRRYV